jgi:hypothetical protein
VIKMNQSAEKTLFGKAMDFMSSTFKESGIVSSNKGKALETVASKNKEAAHKVVNDGLSKAGDAITRTEDKVSKIKNGIKNISTKDGESEAVRDIVEDNAISHVGKKGGEINDSSISKARGRVDRSVKAETAKGVVKDYFANPYKTMMNKEASDEARSLAKRQFIGRTGAAAAGVGAVGAIGYNTLTTGDDAQGHGRTFGGAVGNTVGGTVGMGALGTAGAFGVSMLKKL